MAQAQTKLFSFLDPWPGRSWSIMERWGPFTRLIRRPEEELWAKNAGISVTRENEPVWERCWNDNTWHYCEDVDSWIDHIPDLKLRYKDNACIERPEGEPVDHAPWGTVSVPEPHIRDAAQKARAENPTHGNLEEHPNNYKNQQDTEESTTLVDSTTYADEDEHMHDAEPLQNAGKAPEDIELDILPPVDYKGKGRAEPERRGFDALAALSNVTNNTAKKSRARFEFGYEEPPKEDEPDPNVYATMNTPTLAPSDSELITIQPQRRTRIVTPHKPFYQIPTRSQRDLHRMVSAPQTAEDIMDDVIFSDDEEPSPPRGTIYPSQETQVALKSPFGLGFKIKPSLQNLKRRISEARIPYGVQLENERRVANRLPRLSRSQIHNPLRGKPSQKHLNKVYKKCQKLKAQNTPRARRRGQEISAAFASDTKLEQVRIFSNATSLATVHSMEADSIYPDNDLESTHSEDSVTSARYINHRDINYHPGDEKLMQAYEKWQPYRPKFMTELNETNVQRLNEQAYDPDPKSKKDIYVDLNHLCYDAEKQSHPIEPLRVRGILNSKVRKFAEPPGGVRVITNDNCGGHVALEGDPYGDATHTEVSHDVWENETRPKALDVISNYHGDNDEAKLFEPALVFNDGNLAEQLANEENVRLQMKKENKALPKVLRTFEKLVVQATPKSVRHKVRRSNTFTSRELQLRALHAKRDALRIQPLTDAWDRVVRHAVRNGHDTFSHRDLARVVPEYATGRTTSGVDAWLNDEVINAYLALIAKHGRCTDGKLHHTLNNEVPSHHAFNSFFYKNLSTKGPHAVARWAKRAKFPGKQLLDTEMIFIPINKGLHWTLAVVEAKNKRTITVYNSMGSSGGEQVATNILTWVGIELGPDFIESEWKLNGAGESPQQNNGDDCGVFTITTARQLMLGRMPDPGYKAKDIPTQRKRIVAELIGGGLIRRLPDGKDYVEIFEDAKDDELLKRKLEVLAQFDLERYEKDDRKEDKYFPPRMAGL